MLWATLNRLLRSDRAAVAPTVALSLVGLIATGGIAFDYARLAAMDTELQQAADQAALAAVTQLDRSEDSIDLAEAAVQDDTAANLLAGNFTRFANDGEGAAVEIESITFCSEFDDDVADTAAACEETTDPAEARFVWLQTSLRTANYAFTPIVAAFSGSSHAEAVAGVESSICSIAPLFVCTEDTAFPTEADIGRGLLMKTGAKNSWFPGNYGYLDFGGGNAGIEKALYGNGLNGCRPIDESNTAPGNKSASDAINTRFDLYSGGTLTASLCSDTEDGGGCPDSNVGKDLTMKLKYVEERSDAVVPAEPACGIPATAAKANPEVSYTAFDLDPAADGMPRDDCHYPSSDPTCADGNFGDKVWDRNDYFLSNYGWTAVGTGENSWPTKSGLSPSATRYEVYLWEKGYAGALDPAQVGTTTKTVKTTGNGKNLKTTYTYEKKCAFRSPRNADAADNSRRILPVVAASCAGLNGASDLDAFGALRVFNVFLVEPSFNRTTTKGYATSRVTDEKEIYGEIIGPAETISGGNGFQYYARNRPFLVR